MKTFYKLILLLLFVSIYCFAQTYQVPEVLYYKFNETGADTTENLANPGSGFTWAQLMGTITLGGAGQFGSALVNAGGTSSTNYVNTGWATSLSGSWTISFWVSNMPTGSATLYYVCGDNTAQSFRCFFNGVAGNDNVALRGTGMTDVYIGPVAPGPTVVHFVYDSSVPEIRAYINGALVTIVPQAALSFSGTGPFKVGGYSTSNALPVDAFLDEFRLYNRALDSAEVALTWNQTLPFDVPVELTSFTAEMSENDVVLNWTTATELNNSGFKIERKTENTGFTEIGFVPGNGTTSEPRSYSFVDKDVQNGIYSYRLKQVDFDGSFEYSDVVNIDVATPAYFALEQNYPNPFNPSTKIRFSLASDSKVILTIYNVLGEKIAEALNTDLAKGSHEFDFNASNLNSGVYFYKIEAYGTDGRNYTSIKKMTLTK